MSLLVFGRTGQLALELARLAPDATFAGRDMADLTDPAACAALIADGGAGWTGVINAAAYTAVDKAEADAGTAQRVNADAPAAMARACAAAELPFVHVSTDYVFDGSGTAARAPDAPTGPLGVYGATKLAGEQGVRAAGGRAVILRTSWVFSAHGANFVKTMLRLGAQRPQVTVVGDQIGGPTPAADIARACLTIMAALQGGGQGGTYHFSGAPDVSWADFAREIFRQARLPAQVSDIPTSAYPTPAQRPANSRLDCTATQADFDIQRPDWRDGLAQVLAELETRS